MQSNFPRMLYISYGSVCELETQILLAGDLDLIEKGVLGKLKKDIAENKPLNPWTPFSN